MDAVLQQVRAEMKAAGITASEWAHANGFKPHTVHAVLCGVVKGARGEARRVAVALGLKADAPWPVNAFRPVVPPAPEPQPPARAKPRFKLHADSRRIEFISVGRHDLDGDAVFVAVETLRRSYRLPISRHALRAATRPHALTSGGIDGAWRPWLGLPWEPSANRPAQVIWLASNYACIFVPPSKKAGGVWCAVYRPVKRTDTHRVGQLEALVKRARSLGLTPRHVEASVDAILAARA